MPALSNSQHELFAQAVVKGSNATEAYKSAGYKATGNAAEAAASRLLRDVKVQARIAELQSRIADGIVLTKQWVIEKLIENVKRAMSSQAVLDEDGKPIGEYRYEGSVANRALELLGKEQGMFVERRQVDLRRTTNDLSDDDLAAIITDRSGEGATQAPPRPNGSGGLH